MKRIISIFLLTVLLNMGVYSSAEEYTLPECYVSLLCEGWENNSFKKVTAQLTGYSENNILYCIAAYDNHRLSDISFKTGESGNFSKTLSLNNVGNESDIKVFAWDENFVPLYDGNYERENILYVSQKSSVLGNGTKNNPFLSLENAYETAAIMNCDVTVKMEAGTYSVNEPIKLTVSNDYSVSICGSDYGDTIIDGGKSVTGFSEVEGEEFYVCDIDYDGDIHELYINDHGAKMAQTENVFYPSKIDNTNSTIKFSGEYSLPFDVTGDEDLYISVVDEWKYVICPALEFSKDDADNQTVKISPEYFSRYDLLRNTNNPFVFMNSKAFLDSEGEFYFDKSENKLYYYPFLGETVESIVAYIPQSEGLLSVEGTEDDKIKDLTFENLTFRHGIWNLPYDIGHQTGQAEQFITSSEVLNGYYKNFKKEPASWAKAWGAVNRAQIEISYAENIQFINNRFENMGGGAVHFSDMCTDCKAEGNLFYNIGGAAVTIGSPTHNDILFSNMDKITRNISIKNNFIRKTAQILHGSCAITAFYTDSCDISNNDIADSSYSGISLGWGWGNDVSESRNNKIKNNKIVNIMSDMWDGSHIYTLGNMPGTEISGNYLGRTDEKCGGGGFYPDEGSRNLTFKNNMVENAASWKFILEDYFIQHAATADDGTPIYEAFDKSMTYSGNYVNFLNKYRRKFVDGVYEEKTVGGVTKQVMTTAPSYSGYELVPDEILAGFIEASDFSQIPEAKVIKENAGLTDEYQHLEADFSKAYNTDNGIKKSKYFDSVNFFEVPAGSCKLEGGNNVDFYSDVEYNNSDGCNYYVDLGGRYQTVGLSERGGYTGTWVTYDVTPQKTGYYDIYFSSASTVECIVGLYVDGVLQGKFTSIPASGGLKRPSTGIVCPDLYLEAGKTYCFKVECQLGVMQLYSLIFDYSESNLYENSDTYTETLIASENFADYRNASNTFPFNKTLKSIVPNSGTGFSTPWFDNFSDQTIVSSTEPKFYYLRYNGVYVGNVKSYRQNIYRKLTTPVSFKEDKILRIEYISAFGDNTDVYSGLELLASNQSKLLGIGSYKDTTSGAGYDLTIWNINGRSECQRMSQKKSFAINTFYKYIIELEINSDNVDTLRIKVFKINETEPDSWDTVFKKELGKGSVEYIGINFANLTYFNSFTINELTGN